MTVLARRARLAGDVRRSLQIAAAEGLTDNELLDLFPGDDPSEVVRHRIELATAGALRSRRSAGGSLHWTLAVTSARR